MEKNRPKVIPTVYLVLVNGNKIVLSRRYNTGFQDGNYSFPWDRELRPELSVIDNRIESIEKKETDIIII